MSPKMIFFKEKKNRKIQIISDIEIDFESQKLPRGMLLALDLKKGLVECAPVCVKIEVILLNVLSLF